MRRDHKHRIAAVGLSIVGHHRERALFGRANRESAVDQRGIDLRHVAQAHKSLHPLRPDTPRMPVRTEPPSPMAKSGLCTNCTGSP